MLHTPFHVSHHCCTVTLLSISHIFFFFMIWQLDKLYFTFLKWSSFSFTFLYDVFYNIDENAYCVFKRFIWTCAGRKRFSSFRKLTGFSDRVALVRKLVNWKVFLWIQLLSFVNTVNTLKDKEDASVIRLSLVWLRTRSYTYTSLVSFAQKTLFCILMLDARMNNRFNTIKHAYYSHYTALGHDAMCLHSVLLLKLSGNIQIYIHPSHNCIFFPVTFTVWMNE